MSTLFLDYKFMIPDAIRMVVSACFILSLKKILKIHFSFLNSFNLLSFQYIVCLQINAGIRGWTA